MKSYGFALCVAALSFAQPAAAINKCTGSDGNVSFQDAPCPGGGKGEAYEVRPAAGRAPLQAPVSGSASSATAQTEAARLEKLIAASQRDRRARDLRERLLPDAERGLKEHRNSCAAKQQQLQERQYQYVQNLYGKTHAAQIASEMAALAATCDTKDRELKEALDVLAKECTELHCRAQP